MKAEDLVTWKECREATEKLLSQLCEISDEIINALDKNTGVYVVAYDGHELGGSLWGGKTSRVVFVGLAKFNSSRHFKSGTTGTSTIRRSLAALLKNKLNLVPIPRSDDPTDNDRYTNYKLDSQSEQMLTDWMWKNFRIAFLPLNDADTAEAMHKALIEYNIPMFNFQNNPGNKYGAEIKVCRKRCAEEAQINESKIG